jgi:hypothetical protein
MKELAILLTLMISTFSMANTVTYDEENFEEVTCTYNGNPYPVNTKIGGFACTTAGKWEQGSCLFDGYERRENSKVGPYKCEDGEWVNKLGL